MIGVALVARLEVPTAGLAPEAWRALPDGNISVVVVLGGLAATYAARRPTSLATAHWAVAHRLPTSTSDDVAVELRRLRLWRALPAVLGAAIGQAPGPAYNLAVDVLGPSTPAAERLMAANSDGIYDGLTFAVLGYLLGVVVAELTRRRPAPDVGVARLGARRPEHYLTGLARWLPIVLTTAVTLAQEVVVRRPQRLDDAGELMFDDALRSGASHALTGGSCALLLMWAFAATQTAWVPNGTSGGWFAIVLVVAGLGGTIALWMNYGSAHPGRHPGLEEPRS